MCRGHKTINKTVCKVKFKINKNLEDKIEYPPKGSMLDHDDVYVLTSDIVVVCTTILFTLCNTHIRPCSFKFRLERFFRSASILGAEMRAMAITGREPHAKLKF